MTHSVSFFTPVDYGKRATCAQAVDLWLSRYFAWGGKEVFIAKSGEAILPPRFEGEPWWLTILKVISYVTVIIPLLLLALHAFLRCQQAPLSARSIEQVIAQGIAPLTPEEQDALIQAMPSILDPQSEIPTIYDSGLQDPEMRFVMFSLPEIPDKQFQLLAHPQTADPIPGRDLSWEKWQKVQKLCLESNFMTIFLAPTTPIDIVAQGKTYQLFMQTALSRPWPNVIEIQQTYREGPETETRVRELVSFIAGAHISPFCGFSDCSSIPSVDGQSRVSILPPDSMLCPNALSHFIAILPQALEQVAREEAQERGLIVDDSHAEEFRMSFRLLEAMPQLLNKDSSQDEQNSIQRDYDVYYKETGMRFIAFSLTNFPNQYFQLCVDQETGAPRSKWISIWKQAEEMCRQEQLQTISCYPATRKNIDYHSQTYSFLVQEPIPNEWQERIQRQQENYYDYDDCEEVEQHVKELVPWVVRTGISAFSSRMPLIDGKRVLIAARCNADALNELIALLPPKLETVAREIVGQRGFTIDEARIQDIRRGNFLYQAYYSGYYDKEYRYPSEEEIEDLADLYAQQYSDRNFAIKIVKILNKMIRSVLDSHHDLSVNPSVYRYYSLFPEDNEAAAQLRHVADLWVKNYGFWWSQSPNSAFLSGVEIRFYF